MRVLATLNAHGERWMMLWLYAYIVLVTAVEVIRRFVLDLSSVWGEESARYAFIYLTWIGAAVAIRNRSHIRIDVLLNALPVRGKAFLNAIAHLCAIIFAGFALYWSIEPVLVSFRFGSVTDGLRITKGWFLIAVPLGFTLVLARSLEALIHDINDLRHGREARSGEKLFD
ncbi:MAG: TRAP transporter small permease [Lautropia sp.]|nr:TRAP transporter small permease [Lautropia sp.]